jgi:hypothetical protein
MTSDEIGSVTWDDGESHAHLLSEDEWQVTVDGQDNPTWASLLASVYRGRFQGPQYGPYGSMLLKKVADDLGGTFKLNFDPRADHDPEALY